MIEISTSRENAFNYKTLISELRPEWPLSIVDGDVNLFKLGFISYYPCILQIDTNEKSMCDLDYEIHEMEIDAYNINESLHKKPRWKLNEEERRIVNIDNECIKKYDRYRELYGFWR